MTEKEAGDFFTSFGEVKDVSPVLCSFTRWFVSFSNAYSAAKVPRKISSHKRRYHFYTRKADSWEQPTGSNPCSSDDCYTSANPSCSVDHKHLNILLLPDNCLEDICRNLKLIDQIHFARVCPRLHEVFRMHAKRAYKSFDCAVMLSLTEYEAMYFFRYAGVHIQRLKVKFNYLPKIVKEFLCDFCVNVKRLNLEDSDLPRHLVDTFSKNLKNLQELKLGRFTSIHAIEPLLKISSLEIINLSGQNIIGKFIANMPQLVGLILCDCQLKISDCFYILKSLRRLKLLNTRRTFSQNDYPRVLSGICEYGTELVVLKVEYHNSVSYARLAQLPKLKGLTLFNIYNCCSKTDCTQLLTLLTNLVLYKSNQLEGLNLPCTHNLGEKCVEAISKLKELKLLNLNYSQNFNDEDLRKLCGLKKLQKIAVRSPNITKKGVLELLYNCKNLRLVNVMSCEKIDIDLITEAIKILKEDTLRKPVVFNISGTLSSEAELKDVIPNYKAAKEAGIIKVAFDSLYFRKEFQLDELF